MTDHTKTISDIRSIIDEVRSDAILASILGADNNTLATLYGEALDDISVILLGDPAEEPQESIFEDSTEDQDEDEEQTAPLLAEDIIGLFREAFGASSSDQKNEKSSFDSFFEQNSSTVGDTLTRLDELFSKIFSDKKK